MSGAISQVVFSVGLICMLSGKVNGSELLTISQIVKSLEKSSEYLIVDESDIQSSYVESAVDGMLDGKLTTKLFKYSAENYPNPPITLDSKKDGYGLSVDYEKMTTYGFKFDLGIGFEDRELGTIPVNSQFSLDAMDSVYKASIAIPLGRNFGSREFHLKKMVASKQKDTLNFKSKREKNHLISESLGAYWNIVKLIKEKEIAENSLARFKSLHKYNRVKKRAGIISKAELLSSEVEITNREKNAKDISYKINVEKIKLKSLLEAENLPAVYVEDQSISNLLLGFNEKEIEDLIKSGLSLSQAQTNSELYDSLLKAEKEAAKSNIDLFLSAKSFGRGDSFNESMDENSQDKYELYAGINWSFDINSIKNSSNLGKALSQKRQAVLREKQMSLKLRNGFIEITEKIKSNREQILYLVQIKKQQQEILKAEKNRFKNGKISTLDYVKLQESYDRSSLQIIGLSHFNEILGLNLLSSIGRVELYLENYLKGTSL